MKSDPFTGLQLLRRYPFRWHTPISTGGMHMRSTKLLISEEMKTCAYEKKRLKINMCLMLSIFVFRHRCCSAANGCGILKATWLTGAKFISEENGVYKWNKAGLQANYYLERASDRVMLEINQVPNDIQDFNPKSFKRSIDKENDIFKLPSYCKVQKCSLFSTCRAVG